MTACYEYRTTRHRVAELPAPINGPAAAAAYAWHVIRPDERESEAVAVVLLNTRNNPIGAEIVASGCVNRTNVRLAELFRAAVRVNAAALILAHNHPSDDPTPSPDDLHMTAEAIACGRLLDIAVLDHLVLTSEPGTFTSLRDRGIAFDART